MARLRDRLPGRRAARPAAPPAAEQPDTRRAELAARRERLARELAELQWDLGGLTYEMAIRDHFRLDVLVRRAARLQEVDAELGEIERLLKMEDAGATGSCPSCGALHSRGAVYCWQCGTTLMEVTPAA
ncbi:MAG TPA: zinc ribbon domain-containing protein [Thermoleophilaceae bacterium]